MKKSSGLGGIRPYFLRVDKILVTPGIFMSRKKTRSSTHVVNRNHPHTLLSCNFLAGLPFTLKVKIPGEKRLKTFSCGDPNETFQQFLDRIQSDFPSAKGCTVILDEAEETEYAPGTTIHSALVSEAKVTLAARKGRILNSSHQQPSPLTLFLHLLAGQSFTLKVKIPGEKRLKSVSCSDPDETFQQFLLRVQSKFPAAKGCTLVLDGKEKIEYDPDDTIQSILPSEATVVLAAD